MGRIMPPDRGPRSEARLLAKPVSTSSAFNSEADRLTAVLHAEEISVSRQQSEGDTYRVSTITRERERPVDEELHHQRVEIRRVPISQPVSAMPPVREEGDTTIMSVVEEVVVIERRLMLKEEIHIRRVHVTEHHQETVIVREQEAVITRTEAG
jgi:stress response protein YsnF